METEIVQQLVLIFLSLSFSRFATVFSGDAMDVVIIHLLQAAWREPGRKEELISNCRWSSRSCSYAFRRLRSSPSRDLCDDKDGEQNDIATKNADYRSVALSLPMLSILTAADSILPSSPSSTSHEPSSPIAINDVTISVSAMSSMTAALLARGRKKRHGRRRKKDGQRWSWIETDQLSQCHSLCSQSFRCHPEEIGIEPSRLVYCPHRTGRQLQPQSFPKRFRPDRFRLTIRQPCPACLAVVRFSYRVTGLDRSTVVQTCLQSLRIQGRTRSCAKNGQ